MNKVWEIVIDIFVGILIMFVSVIVYFGLKTETVMKSMYKNITDEFITEVKKNGVMTLNDYEKFMERMDIGHNIFDIEFEHRHTVLEPEYRFKTLEEIQDELKYKGPNEYHYRDVITERPHVEDPINTGNLNTETNESVLAKAKDGPPDPNHVHDEGCFIGHKHQGEPYFIHTHQHFNCVEFESTRWMKFTCNQCNKKGISFFAAWYWDGYTVRFSHMMEPLCGNCGSNNLRDTSTISNYAYSCGYSIDIDGDGFTDAVGYHKAYQYKMPYPEKRNITTKQTVISGCYKYHEYGTYWPEDPGYVYQAQRTLLEKGFEAFCTIPQYITALYYWNSKWDGSGEIPVTFEVFIDGNGKFKLKSSTTLKDGYYYYTIQLPTVDFNTFRKLCTDRYEMYKFLSENLTGKYVYNNGSVGISSWSGEIDICDEPIHNTWYTICGQDEDDTIGCNHIIISLVPTHPNQTVYVNDPLITTAIATYKDGSTKTVVCTTNFTTTKVGKDQDVTLIYNYTINGKSYSKSCNIKVTVIPRNKTCSKGHTYNLNHDGTDPGCPYCRAWVESLRVIYPETVPIVITIGTSLQDNGVKLLATYMDGHTEIVTSGYVDNLDNKYLGTKPVTIGYKGATVTVLVTTKCATVICDICGYEYDLWPDGTNPGCPRCRQKIPVFTGNIMEYEHINHTEEILESLYNKGIYVFNDNDIFKISVKSKNTNIARTILHKVYPSLSKRWFILDKSEYIKAK